MVCFEFNSVEIAVSNLSDIEVNRGKPCQILTLIVAIDCQKQLINFQSLLSYQIVVIITKHNIVMINFVQEQRHAELRLVATQVKLSGECIRLIYTWLVYVIPLSPWNVIVVQLLISPPLLLHYLDDAHSLVSNSVQIPRSSTICQSWCS